MTTGNTFGMPGPTRNNHDLREFCKPTADLKKGRLFFTRAALSTGGRARNQIPMNGQKRMNRRSCAKRSPEGFRKGAG